MNLLTAQQVYKELADWYERQEQAAMRDRFLILSAEAAFSAGNADEAERLRQRLLKGNPHHMLKPFSSFAQALQSTNIQIYIHDLQVNYPPQTAEDLLRDLRSGVSPLPLSAAEGPTIIDPGSGINPVIEIGNEATLPIIHETEPLKVYPLRNEPRPAVPAAPPVKPAPQERPAPRKTTTAPSGKAPLRPRPQPIPLRPAAPVSVPTRHAEPAAPAGAWLPLILFGMTVTAAITLAFYTLARPFLPLP